MDERALVDRCLAHDPEALRVLEAHYVKKLGGALAALGIAPADRDEVAQKLWLRLVVDDPPRLASWEGRGSLLGFVRAVAVRLALDERRAAKPTAPEDAILDLADGALGPEAALDKRISRRQFRDAFEAAVANLKPKQRTLLRQVYVDGLANDAVAQLYGTHRATVFRWLIDARRDLAKLLREELARALGLPVEDVPHFAAFVQSQLSLSLARVFG
jgi:RNA polymerase sigma-70 factor (ECF subfamily)